jgi:hypothetical protein
VLFNEKFLEERDGAYRTRMERLKAKAEVVAPNISPTARKAGRRQVFRHAARRRLRLRRQGLGRMGSPASAAVNAFAMLVLFTDYGWHDPYVGQVKAVMAAEAPGVAGDRSAARGAGFQRACRRAVAGGDGAVVSAGSVFFCVVDPGVGAARDAWWSKPMAAGSSGRTMACFPSSRARAPGNKVWHIHWRPDWLCPPPFTAAICSRPIAAWIAAGQVSLRQIDS